MTTSLRIAFLAACAALSLPFTTGAADESVTTINGQSYTRDQLETAYQGVIKEYGRASQKGGIATRRQLESSVFFGEVIDAYGTLNIVDLGAGYAALVGRQRYPANTPNLTFMGKKLGAHRWVDPDGHEHVIPQYKDLTLSRADFVRHLRAGYPFAEPSLLTRPIAGNTKMLVPNRTNPAATKPATTAKPQATGLRKGKPGSLSARPGSQFQRKPAK